MTSLEVNNISMWKLQLNPDESLCIIATAHPFENVHVLGYIVVSGQCCTDITTKFDESRIKIYLTINAQILHAVFLFNFVN